MTKVKQIARLILLVMVTLGLTMAASAVLAASSEPASHGAEQAVHAAADSHGTVADAHGDAAGDHGDAHHGGSLSKEKLWDLAFRIMNFAVLVILLVKFAAKPIGSSLASRQQQIKDEIEDLEARKTAAETSYKEFEAKLTTVEAEIDTIVDKAVAQAEVEKAKILEKAEAAAADIKRQAEIVIQNEITEAKRNLKNDVADQASVMAEELIVKNLTADDQVKIIEDYLDKVGAVQ